MGFIEFFAWLGVAIAVIIYTFSLLIFFRILALKENRTPNSVVKEIFDLKPHKWFRGDYIDIFPLTALSVLLGFRKFDKEELDKKLFGLYKLKILLDLILILLFLGGLALVFVRINYS